MRRARRVFYFIAAFVFTAGALLALLHHSGLFEVVSIPVDFAGENGRETNVPAVATTRMKAHFAASLEALKGKRIWEIDIRDLRASLVRNEWVKDVTISRRLPNEVLVKVRPRNVALVFIDKYDKFIPVTEEGEFLSPLPAASLPDVPFLRGEIFAKERERRESAVKLALALGEEGFLSRRNVSEISWTSEEGYALTLLQPKVEVKLGEEHIDLKAMRVSQVLNYLSANNLKGRVIDASFSKKVLVRLRKDP